MGRQCRHQYPNCRYACKQSQAKLKHQSRDGLSDNNYFSAWLPPRESFIIKSIVLKVLPDAKFYFTENLRNTISIISSRNIDLIFCDLEFNNNEEIEGFIICEKLLKLKPNLKLIAHTNYNSYRVM